MMASGKLGKKPKDNIGCQLVDIIHQNSSKILSVVLFYSFLFAILPLQMEFSWNFTTGASESSGPGLALSFAAPNRPHPTTTMHWDRQRPSRPRQCPRPGWSVTKLKFGLLIIPNNYGLASRLPWLYIW